MTKSTKNRMNKKQDEMTSPSKKKSSGGCLSKRCADCCLDWVVFPALLFVQFGATIYCQVKEGVPQTLDWRVVHFSIFLFCLVAGLYRRVLRRQSWDSKSLVLLLLPEIFTNILLATVMFSSLETAFETLVVFTLLLTVLGLFAAATASTSEGEVASLEDYQLLLEKEEDDDEEEWLC